jgi:hypothetical protein
MSAPIVPVVVFAYTRVRLLQQLLQCLKRDQVPLLYVFCDAPKSERDRAATEAVQELVQAIDWCDVRVTLRPSNLGLGRSILSGVTEILDRHPSTIVFEDDLVCSAGTYRFLCEGLARFASEPKVMSITGWTHPKVQPQGSAPTPYFDGRSESWSFATWTRAWRGMDASAARLFARCRLNNVDVYRYGADLVAMARTERERNLWAVRWAYHHIVNGGLCLRPGRSLVDHRGTDGDATNAPNTEHWSNPDIAPFADLPERWPAPVERAECPELWQQACGGRPRGLGPYVDDLKLLFSPIRGHYRRRYTTKP